MKVFHSRKVLKPLVFVLALLVTSVAVYATTYISFTSFKSNTGTTITVAEHGVGKNVTNTSGKSYFIPTGSPAEWNSFVLAAPSLPGVSLSSLSWSASGFGSCSVSCGGGTQTQSVWCAGGDGSTVADSYCTGSKPTTIQSCNTQACVYALTNVVHSTWETDWYTKECGGSCQIPRDSDYPICPPTSGAPGTCSYEWMFNEWEWESLYLVSTCTY